MSLNHLPEDVLSALIDTQLSPAEATAAAEHVAGCGLCEGQLAELRSIRDLLRNLPQLEVPRDFSLGPRLVQAPANVIRLRQLYTWTRIGAASLAACFVLLVGGAVYLDSLAPSGHQATETTSRVAAPASQPAPAAAQRAPSTPAAARPAAPAAVPRAATPAAEDSQPEQVAAGTESKPLPTPTPTSTPAPVVVAQARQPAAAASADPAAPARTAAAIVGVLTALAALVAVVIRGRLTRQTHRLDHDSTSSP